MNQEEKEYQVIGSLENVIRTAHKNFVCLYPECNKRPIGSHVIARKTLALIAEKSHVKTWLEVSAWDMKRSYKAGRSFDQLYEEPVCVGITDRNKITLPLFCEDHDSQIFASLEREEFSFHPEQVALLAYRALCSMTLDISSTVGILSVAEQHGYHLPLSEPERFQKLQRFQMTDLMVNVRQYYAQLHQTHDYTQLGWSIYLVNKAPCIAATYALIPVDDDDALAIINGSQTVTVEDAVNFSFLPYQSSSSICVISWLRGSPRAQRFMTLNRINELSEKEQNDLFLRLAFESPNLYISPQWWQFLSDDEREEYKKIHRDAGREHAKLV